MRVTEDSIEILTRRASMRRVQEAMKPYRRTDGSSVVDELIAERRAEAAREWGL
jgi:hypothetical protein